MVNDRYVPNFILNIPVRGLVRFPISVFAKYLKKGYLVVDMGSGPGYYSVKLARMKLDLRIISIDPNSLAVARLKKLSQENGLNNITPLCLSANSLNTIDDNSVDFAVSHLMLCCMSDHDGAMKETMRILKPGHFVFLSVNKRSSSKDKRDVSAEEWNELKKQYKVIEEGSSLISRWAVIQKDGEISNNN